MSQVAYNNQVFTYPQAREASAEKANDQERVKQLKSLASPVGSLVLWIGFCAYLLDKYAMGLVS